MDDVCTRTMVYIEVEWFVEVVEYSVAVDFYCIIAQPLVTIPVDGIE